MSYNTSASKLLFIRACKSLNPYQRVHSVYRRQYCKVTPNEALHNIAALLLEIYEPVGSISHVVNELNPSNSWKYIEDGQVYSYMEVLTKVLISGIRYMSTEHFPGYVVPARFRTVPLITNSGEHQ